MFKDVFKTVVVALDEEKLSERLLKTLENLKIQPSAKIVLVHVMPESSDRLDVASDRPDVDKADPSSRYLEQFQPYQAVLPCPSEVEVVSGDPAEEIVRLAHIHNADLIVMGSRGLTGLSRVLQGSVSGQVVADAPCSVLVVKSV